MNKKIRNIVSLKIPSCEASSKPPLGSMIGQFGVPIMDFCNLFNKITLDNQYKKGILVNCSLIIYNDFSFDLKLKTIDLSYLLKIAISDKLLLGKKNLSFKKGRVQSILYGIKKRKNRKKKKKINNFYLSSCGLFEITQIKYLKSATNISFLSYYKTVFGTCRSMGFFIYPSFYLSNPKKIKESFLLNLIANLSEKEKKKYLICKKTNNILSNKLAFY
jgi:large subunit ribosomal protein L11